MKVSLLKFNPNNPRRISPDHLDKLKASIDSFPEMMKLRPIVYDPDTMQVLGGNQRLAAIKALGMKEIPDQWAVAADKLTEKQKKEFVLKDNIPLGEWDFAILESDFAEFDLGEIGIDVPDGFDIDDPTEAADTEPQIDKAAELQEKWQTKLGQIWQCGKHRVMCGDSTKQEEVEMLMGGQNADMAITDPPYNVAVNNESEESLKARNRRSDGLKIKNDKMTNKDFETFLRLAFSAINKSIKDGAPIYVFYGESEVVNFITQFINSGFHFAQNCIWKKQQFVMTRKDYHYKHEPVIYGWKVGSAHKWFGDRKQSTVWEFDRPRKSENHPTMKPIDLISYPIINSSAKNELVLDTFLGSGSTLIACENTNRICYGMEIDPTYVAVVLQRYQDHTGKTPELING